MGESSLYRYTGTVCERQFFFLCVMVEGKEVKLMKQAIIDIGSNSIRLTVYEIRGNTFMILFKEKFMAGLAGYVEDGVLSGEGLDRAREGLLEFRERLQCFSITAVSVIATASLRNIVNTEEAVRYLEQSTGFEIEVIDGHDEALYGHCGAMLDLDMTSGAVLDIGGASTELVVFNQDQIEEIFSFHFGSLSLYKNCVKKVMPGKGSAEKILETVENEVSSHPGFTHDREESLVSIGGTGRAVLKIATVLYNLPEGNRTVTDQQVNAICELLLSRNKKAMHLILKLVPDRIHTIVPGILVLRYFMKLFQAKKLIVSNYGVREGYLCQKLLKTALQSPCRTVN